MGHAYEGVGPSNGQVALSALGSGRALPHGCHRLLSIRRRSALPQCELCPEVSPRSCSCYPCWLLASTGLYRGLGGGGRGLSFGSPRKGRSEDQ